MHSNHRPNKSPKPGSRRDVLNRALECDFLVRAQLPESADQVGIETDRRFLILCHHPTPKPRNTACAWSAFATRLRTT